MTITVERMRYHGPGWVIETQRHNGFYRFLLWGPRAAEPELNRPERVGWTACWDRTVDEDEVDGGFLRDQPDAKHAITLCYSEVNLPERTLNAIGATMFKASQDQSGDWL